MEQKTVLIVEDDGILAVQLRDMLVGLGYNVPKPVATGAAAIAAVAAEHPCLILPDLILMDIQLAGKMDGITAAEHISSVADVPIIFLTGYSQDPLLQRAKLVAPYGYLIKPVSSRELAATIEMAFYRHSLDLQLREHKVALQKANDELEWRVQDRTVDLISANENLRIEMEDRIRAEAALQKSNKMLQTLSVVQSHHIAGLDVTELFNMVLDDFIVLTDSKFGFIGEIMHTPAGDNYLTTFAITNIAWNNETRKFYEKELLKGLEFYNLKTLFGAVLKTGKAVIANDPVADPRRGGLPEGHPPLSAFLGLPIHHGKELVGMVGLANRPGGFDDNLTEYLIPFLFAVGNIIEANRNRKRREIAEVQVYKSNATLNMAIDGISDPLFMLDAEFRVKRLNRAARDYLGLASYPEAIGKLCFEAFRGNPSPCEGCERPFSELRGYSGSYERKGLIDPNRLEQVIVDVVKDEHGVPEASIVRIHDITQAKMMDRQLIQSEKLASLGMLVAGIAHEINNPNNFIFFNTPILRSYLKFLLPIVDEYVSAHPEMQAFGRPYPAFREDCFKLLDNIEHGSTRINQMVKNLREFVRERGKGEMRLIDLKQVVEKGISICLGRIKKYVTTFESNIPEGLPALVTDPLAIEQVVVNLLINAAQAADKKDSWIRLTITSQNESEGEVIIEVCDNGCGMDTETQKKIFDPFFTTKAVGVGTGLGMSISHRLVTELGGCIEVRSELGKGSSFSVRLKRIIGDGY
jgi:signal transduction histidine kinase/CheY-like chemotaxis protein